MPLSTAPHPPHAATLPIKPIAVSMGEPAGIGAECLLKSWQQRDKYGLAPFFVVGDPAAWAAVAEALHLPVPIMPVTGAAMAAMVFGEALPVLPLPLAAPVQLGMPDARNAPMVLASIEQSLALVRQGAAAALVTLPIHKSTLYQAGFRFPGHTEFLASLCNPATPYHTVMLLEIPGLRVALSTVHLALKDALHQITTARIVENGLTVARSLRQHFGIASPRLAVAALNPHAGENGALGREEIEIIRPAIEQLQARGVLATGPWPSDTLFHAEARAQYDCALCLYHDQGLIPIKTLDFHGGVNITLGLPIIRTSPDHGTALDIASNGCANPASLIAALQRAGQLASPSLE